MEGVKGGPSGKPDHEVRRSETRTDATQKVWRESIEIMVLWRRLSECETNEQRYHLYTLLLDRTLPAALSIPEPSLDDPNYSDYQPTMDKLRDIEEAMMRGTNAAPVVDMPHIFPLANMAPAKYVIEPSFDEPQKIVLQSEYGVTLAYLDRKMQDKAYHRAVQRLRVQFATIWKALYMFKGADKRQMWSLDKSVAGEESVFGQDSIDRTAEVFGAAMKEKNKAKSDDAEDDDDFEDP